MMPTPRILIVDDHEVVRRGLRVLLESRPGWQVVGEADSGRAALALAEELRPHVAIVDLVMPEMNGLELTRQLLSVLPQVAVLILTMHDVDQVVRDAVSVGAKGYLLKSAAGPELVKAVEALHRGQTYFSGVPNPGNVPAPVPLLSPREREVVQLLAEGRTSKEVAVALDISPRTVESHRANIMTKLRLTSLADLVRYAIRNGLAPP